MGIIMKIKFKGIAILFFLLIANAVVSQQIYNPLEIEKGEKVETVDLTFEDSKRKREIPVKIYYADVDLPAPVILFSHGLGGSREGSSYLGKHWAARGYICIFIQHPGSDEAVWKDKPKLLRKNAMRKAANVENFLLRIKDVSFVIDKLEELNKDKNSNYFGKFDLNRIGMSGHSFGARTTQAVCGEVFKNGKISYVDKRIKAAIPMSPSSAKNSDAKISFSSVSIPWMLMTGTKDIAAIGDQDLESRLSVFPSLPAGDKYQIVLHNGEHSAFTDRALPGDSEQRNPNHHKVILALSTAFWDAHLKKDKKAEEWLKGNGPHTIIKKEDEWKIK
jgi:predicted dienelactone hydrolase